MHKLTTCLIFFLLTKMALAGTSEIQFIHASADTTLDTVDIYFNNVLRVQNFTFRSATAFGAVNSGIPVAITITHKHSANIGDSIKTFYYDSLTDEQSYIFILSGLNSSGFSANPDGRNTDFDLKLITPAYFEGPDTGQVVAVFFNGVTDLPAINIQEKSGGQLWVNNLAYGAYTRYLEDYANTYHWQVIKHDSSTTYGIWKAPLDNYKGRVMVVFTAGFYDSTQNNSGADLGLFAAQTDGSVLQFEPERGYLQLIHNSADPLADSLDIYFNGKKLFNSLVFRTATGASPVIADVPYNIGIALKNSTSVSDTFWNRQIVPGIDTFYVWTISGLLGTGFVPNPNGQSTAFQVLEKAPAEMQATSGVNFDFFFIHGCTDAPALNMKLRGGPPLITNSIYTDQSNYFSLPLSGYQLDVRETANSNLLGTYVASLQNYAGQSGAIVASGFYTPGSNNNGSALDLFLVPTVGGPFRSLTPGTAINDLNELGGNLYPVPSRGDLFVDFELKHAEDVQIKILDASGRTVLAQQHNYRGIIQHSYLNLNQLADGLYFIEIKAAAGSYTSKFILQR